MSSLARDHSSRPPRVPRRSANMPRHFRPRPNRSCLAINPFYQKCPGRPAGFNRICISTRIFCEARFRLKLGHDLGANCCRRADDAFGASRRFPLCAGAAPTAHASRRGRARPFADHAVDLEEMLTKLLERETERKEPLCRFAFHLPRQSLASYGAELLDVLPERDFDAIQRWWRLLRTQGGARGAEEIAPRNFDIPERLRQARGDLPGQLASDRAAQHYDVMAQPQQRAQKRSGVGTGGEARIAFMLGLDARRVQPHQRRGNSVVNPPPIRLVEL